MPQLQLADGYPEQQIYMQDCHMGECYMADPVSLIQSGAAQIEDFYLMVPDDAGNWHSVREDLLDDLPEEDYEWLLLNQPFMGGLFSGNPERKARRQSRKAQKAELQAVTREGKISRRAAGETGWGRFTKGVTGMAKAIVPQQGAVSAYDPQQQGAVPPTPKGLSFTGGYTQGFDWNSPVVIVGGIALLGAIGFAIAAGRKRRTA